MVVEKTGKIEIKVVGKFGNQELKPDNFDIRHIAKLMQDVEHLLFPNSNKDRPLIAYDIAGGSVTHIFKTTQQAVIGFSALLDKVADTGSIDFLELKTARAFENIQEMSRQKDYRFHIKTSVKADFELIVSPETRYFRTENVWADAEFYFYGVLKNAGGKSRANIHLDTDEYGYLTIQTDENFLRDQEENMLYKKYGVRVKGRQNIETGEIDRGSLKLIELIDYDPKFDQDYLSRLISKAKKNWKGIDPDEWLHKLRGDYEA